MSTPSTRRSNSGTTRRCGADRSSSGPAWSSRPATRPRPTGSGRRWEERRRSGSALTRSSSAHGWMPTARPARRCSRCSTTRRRSWKASRSTRRSSMSEDCAGSRAPLGDRRPVAMRCPRACRTSRHGGGGPHEVPRQGGERGGQAERVARGAARRRAGLPHPLPVERLWGVGPVTAAKPTRGRSRPWRRSPPSARRHSFDPRPGRRPPPPRARPQP